MAADEERPLKVLVVGLGPIGRRHVRNGLALGHEVALARRSGSAPSDGPDVPVFAGLERAVEWGPEAVVVATPPSAHEAAALWALERGLPVLVEKPLAVAPAAAERLLGEAASRGVFLAVGHNLRFHPALRAIEAAVAAGRVGRLLAVRAEVGSFLPDWHPELDYRASSAARRQLGGGALLTLVHELDYVLWIAGDAEPAGGVAARTSELELDVEDVAELLLRHGSGAVASVHMDLLDRAYNRRSRWIGEEGTVEWSWGGPVRLLRGREVTVLWDDPGFDLNETYIAELAAFLAGEPAPGRPLEDARRALEIAESVTRP